MTEPSPPRLTLLVLYSPKLADPDSRTIDVLVG
jgi:hypothetical protein